MTKAQKESRERLIAHLMETRGMDRRAAMKYIRDLQKKIAESVLLISMLGISSYVLGILTEHFSTEQKLTKLLNLLKEGSGHDSKNSHRI